MTDTKNALVNSREALYGEPVDNCERIAKIWSGILGFDVQPVQVPLMLSAMKLYRASITPDYSDNMDDADGYVAMARTVVGENMIHARTAAEYFNAREIRDAEVETACRPGGLKDKYDNPPYTAPEAEYMRPEDETSETQPSVVTCPVPLDAPYAYSKCIEREGHTGSHKASGAFSVVYAQPKYRCPVLGDVIPNEELPFNSRVVQCSRDDDHIGPHLYWSPRNGLPVEGMGINWRMKNKEN